MIDWILSENSNPPMPLPAAVMPLAMLRFTLNHWLMVPTEEVNRKPMPQPKTTPCVRKRCQIFVEKDAAIRDPVWKNIPMHMPVLVVVWRIQIVTIGAISMDWETERPPMKANWRGVAPGYLFSVR